MKRMLLLSLCLSALFLSRSIRAEDPHFTIGVVAPLTGPVADFGVAVRNGFGLARIDRPDIFTEVDFKFEDDRYDVKTSLSAFNKLKDIDKVDLIYLWGTGPAGATSPIAEEQHFPLVIVSSDPAPSLGRKWIFRFGNYSEQYILALLEFLRTKEVKRVGLLKTELGYIDGLVNAFRQNLLRDEKLIDIATLQPGDLDLNTSIARISNVKLDSVAVFLMPGQIAQFYRKSSGRFSVPVTIGTDFFESTTEIKSAGPGIEGAIFPNNVVESWFAEQ